MLPNIHIVYEENLHFLSLTNHRVSIRNENANDLIAKGNIHKVNKADTLNKTNLFLNPATILYVL